MQTLWNSLKNYEGRKEAEQFKKQNIVQKTRENVQARGINC